jgi:hypothetical protein
MFGTKLLFGVLLLGLFSCENATPSSNSTSDEEQDGYSINRADYAKRLEGFWLGTCLANWTGLITEMDKIGNIGEPKTGDFYTRDDWGKADQPNIWSETPSDIAPTIDFVLMPPDSIWGADDDTDIEYIYQEALLENETSRLSGEHIRTAWLKHIQKEEENYLWVSNEKAFELMQKGLVPPATGDPKNNPEYEMIDAQLTTEIFGLYAPTRPDIAVELAKLPIQNVARYESEDISKFYVAMFALALVNEESRSQKEQLFWMAKQAKTYLTANTYPEKMYNYVQGLYESGITWEQARDSVYIRYQVEQQDGYELSSRELYCNACFAAGINFAASLVSLFYGEGDLKETIKIGALSGWDSDNPTATWGGLLGFMMGKEKVEAAFGQPLSNRYNIHRTRINFSNDGIDSFEAMGEKGLKIIDRVVGEELGGRLDVEKNVWHIPRS